jgi:hypothetical protein
MSIAAQDLELRNALLAEEKEVLVANLINCQKALDINKATMVRLMTEHNTMKDDFAVEISSLRAKIKELTSGTHSRLG